MITNSLTIYFRQQNIDTKIVIYWIFRIAVASEFIGQCAFGIITKEIWIPYFNLFGIDRATGYSLMPFVGSIYIILGVVTIICPMRSILAWYTP